MTNIAFDLIRDDMVENHGNDAITVIGDFLLDDLKQNPQHAPLIKAAYDSKKNLKTAFKTIEDYARKHQQNRCAVVSPVKAIELVLSHFGLSKPDAASQITTPAAIENSFDIRLEDLL
jgi:hypothetical protein